MRKTLLVAAMAASFALAGCASVPGGGGNIDITRIQETAKQICGFVPTVSTVASIIATFTGGGATVDMIGQAAAGICAAITAKAARRSAGPAKYRGVVIRGTYTGR